MRPFVLPLLIMFAVVSGCRKNDTLFNAYFWTSVDTTQSRLSLFVDGEPKGPLPYLENEPSCGDVHALALTLRSGKYRIEARDEHGTVRSQQTCKITEHKLSASGTVGGERAKTDGHCLVIGLFY